jgi:molecular chaperone GrpE
LAIKDHQKKNGEAEMADAAPAKLEDKKIESEKEKLTEEITTLENELELERRKSLDLSNRMKYLHADIANLQRQSDRRVAEVRNQVKLAWILEVLSIKEDLDRAVGVAREAHEKSSLLDGLLLVTSRIENILKLEAVEVIRAEVGGRFDPTLHEALAFQESDNEEQGTILAVISLGYSVEGKVIKPAMVEVARTRQKSKSPGQNGQGENIARELEIEEATRQKNA